VALRCRESSERPQSDAARRPSADALHAPRCQSSFSCCRIILDPVNRLTRKPYGLCDLADACGLVEHRLRTLELLAAVARLAAPVRARFTIGSCVRDTSALRFLCRFCLCLRRCCHESDQGVPHCALHGVLGRAVKGNAVYDRADYNTALHELANGFANVLVVATKAVNPANDEHVARPEQVEETTPLGPLSELSAHPGYPIVPDDLVELEASLLGLSALVLDCLLTCADARVQDRGHVPLPEVR
jgi:hypothetical protein